MQVAPWALVWALGKLHHAVAPLVPYGAHESNLAAVARFLEVHVTILTHLPLCLLVFVLQVLHLFTLWGQVRQSTTGLCTFCSWTLMWTRKSRSKISIFPHVTSTLEQCKSKHLPNSERKLRKLADQMRSMFSSSASTCLTSDLVIS